MTCQYPLERENDFLIEWTGRDLFNAVRERDLTLEQIGCYVRLLDAIDGCLALWSIGEAEEPDPPELPDDDDALGELCGLSGRDFALRIRPAIAPLFRIAKGVWRHPGLEGSAQAVRELLVGDVR